MLFKSRYPGTFKGVEKKIHGQFMALHHYASSVKLLTSLDDRFSVSDKTGTLASYKIPGNLIWFTIKFYWIAYKELKKSKPGLVFVRFAMTEPFFLMFLYAAKRLKSKVVIEFPTYPYEPHYNDKKLKSKCLLIVDKVFRGFLKKWVNIAVTYTDYDEIYGMPGVRIGNGIDISGIKIKQSCTDFNSLNFIAVAQLSVWHGYDRIIKGLYAYYSNKKPAEMDVKITVIGNGPAKKGLEDLTRQLNLQDKVFFKGQLEGSRLNEEYNLSHIGIGSLAR